MDSQGALVVQSAIVTAICNLGSSRAHDVATVTRSEGWSETWGLKEKTKTKLENFWKHEDDYAERLLSTPPSVPNDVKLTLFQYRPAWFEQIVLRMAGLEHVVINSSYFSTEANGPLPLLQELPKDDDGPPAVVVGRHDPRAPIKAINRRQNEILAYLMAEKGIDMDKNLSAEQQSMSQLCINLIQTQLHKSLLWLRYEEREAWEQVYRKQGWDASRHKLSTSTSWYAKGPSVMGVFQAWSERVLARKALLLGESREMSSSSSSSTASLVEDAACDAKKAYSILELHLQEKQVVGDFFFGTNEPSLVDAILFDHLADALCNVHLVVVLADFPVLVNYFQKIHDRYFMADHQIFREEVSSWNRRENKLNPFQQLPLEVQAEEEQNDSPFRNAIDLMQKLSVHQHNMHEVLVLAKQKRQQEEILRQKEIRTSSLANSAVETQTSDSTAEAKDQKERQEKLLREKYLDDQRWMSAVVLSAVTVVGLATWSRTIQ